MTHDQTTPAPVEVTQADRMLVEAIINDYHTTRLDSDYVSHILSKPRTRSALARHRIAHSAPADLVELVEALRELLSEYVVTKRNGGFEPECIESWGLVTDTRALLAKHGDA